jgi:hypothetical protein
MHYHRALVDLFSGMYGQGFVKILKPSPQKEAWVGFDQGWARMSVSEEELIIEFC